MAKIRLFVKDVAASVWQAHWWITAVIVLCVADLVIRMSVFHPGFPRAALLRSVRLFLFYAPLAVVPAFCLGRSARFVAPVFFCFWFLVEALQLWVARSFNMVLGGNWVLMAFSTSGTELREFASGFATFGGVACLVCVLASAAAVAWFFAGRHRERPLFSCASAFVAVACIALSCMMAPKCFRAPVSWAQISRDLLALNFPVDTFANWRSYRHLAAACREEPPFDLSLTPCGGQPPLCVFVIGESTTRNHMGIYGYSRNTTPQLEAIKAEGGLAVFTDLEATHTSTPEALCALFTGCDLAAGQHITAVFPAMLKKAGYETALVSCQGSWQNKDVVGTHLFMSCGSRKFLQEGRVAGTLPDGVVLPEVENALKRRSGPLALFIHLYGCHQPATRRVPKDFVREWPSAPAISTEKARRKLDSYDTAVAYNDYIVASIIRMVAAQGTTACVFFVSDHGESPTSPIWRDAKSRDTFEVPLVVWLSPEYLKAFPKTAERVAASTGKKLFMDQLMGGMLEIAGVAGYGDADSCGNFLSPSFHLWRPNAKKEDSSSEKYH